jgi:hypothetical protein
MTHTWHIIRLLPCSGYTMKHVQKIATKPDSFWRELGEAGCEIRRFASVKMRHFSLIIQARIPSDQVNSLNPMGLVAVYHLADSVHPK